MPVRAFILSLAFWGSPLTSSVELDPVALETFADGYIDPLLEATGVPGVGLAVVQDDSIVLLKGYGVRDIETGEPVDPHTTVYRLGSMTKPLIGLTVLQLVEQGTVDLDTDINAYLTRVKIPDLDGEPVTLRQLLTHRAGFDADMTGSGLPPGSSSRMSDAALQRRIQRVRRPGHVASYDVLGFGLAGLVIQDVTGLSLDDAVARAVLDPLGMTRSFLGLPEGRVDEIARCHVSTGPGTARTCGHPVLAEFLAGSGDLSGSAGDVARLMIALLDKGRFDDVSLVEPATFREFVDFDGYRFHPSGPGLGLGIREYDYAGRRAFGHGGGINGFDNSMDLFPAAGIGIYLGVNGGPEQIYDARLSNLPRLVEASSISPEAARAFRDLTRFSTAFAEKFIPVESLPISENVAAYVKEQGARRLAGRYYSAREVSNNLMVRFARRALGTSVTALDDRSILVDGMGPYHRVEPLLYRDPEDGHTVAFRVTAIGTFLAFRGDPYMTYERLPWYASPAVSIFTIPLTFLVLLTGVVYLFPPFEGDRRRVAGFFLFGAALVVIGFVLELELGTSLAEIEGEVVAPLVWRLGQLVGVSALVVGAVLAVTRVVQRRISGLLTGGHFLTLSAAAMALVLLTAYWR